jgi:hypothetical protein
MIGDRGMLVVGVGMMGILGIFIARRRVWR